MSDPRGFSSTTQPVSVTGVGAQLPPPAVTSVTPAFGPAGGGRDVTVTGTNGDPSMVVRFGSAVATIRRLSGFKTGAWVALVKAPPGTGVVDVTATTASGTSPTAPRDQYSYAPAVIAIKPAFGPTMGGTHVTITGTNADRSVVVRFGSAVATITRFRESKTGTWVAVVKAPPGAGVVDVTAATAGGTSPTAPRDQFSYAPAVSSIKPAFGPASGGTHVTITGTNADRSAIVRFGSAVATSARFVAGGEGPFVIAAVAPPGTGVVDVTVTTAGGGTSSTGPQDRYSYAPVVTAIKPAFGPASGGTHVTITGTNADRSAVVRFGSAVGRTARFARGAKAAFVIVAVAPPGTGVVDVTVTTAVGGTSPTGPQDRYSYGPTITAVKPAFGPAQGGTSVTLTGTGLTGATAVHFGTVRASFIFNSGTQVVATAPRGTGTVDVTVATPSGTSAKVLADRFTYYVAVPSVSAVSPPLGPAGGNTTVTVTGTGFSGASQVSFGSLPATSFTVDSDTQISAVSPPQPSGAVDVTVTTPGGTSPTNTADRFIYEATVTAITPKVGPLAGGTKVVVTGMGLSTVKVVYFGPGTQLVATGLTIVSDTQIEFVTPPHPAGAVDLFYADQSTIGALGTWFTYVAVPSVSAVSPPLGPAGGNTTVTVTGTGFSGASQVSFGSLPATSFTVDSDTQISAVSPPQPSGAVDVTVTTPGGTSPTNTADRFTYTSAGPPQITAMQGGDNPCPGCVVELNTSGGTVVTISGSGFTGATEVRLDTTEWQIDAVSFTVLDDHTLQATMPGTPNSDVLNIDVRVITPAGISPITPADHAIFNF